MQAFEGGSPTFEAVDGSGIIVAAKLISGNVIAPRSGDGGFGSVGDVLLGVNSARGTFRWGAVLKPVLLAVRFREISARHLH